MTVIACGAIAREIGAVVAANRLDHVTLTCLPAILHNAPQKIVPAVEAAIAAARGRGCQRIFVAYADCGTGGALDALCQREKVARIPGPHCYAFFRGNRQFAEEADAHLTTFWLTDFLARQFDAFVARPFKLDRHPEMVGMLFGNYERVVYLAQTDDAVLDRRARAIAARLGLAYERRLVGYGDLTPALVDAAAGG
nr:DUF1638 domain-containing protein [Aurantimonas aggregata]